MFKYTLLILFLVGAIGCSTTPKPTKVPQNMASRNVKPVLIIADPQIHNIYGLRLKQMMGLADLGSKVAIRPAELNILAPLLLEESIKRNKKAIQAIIVLGDSTNIACENESNIFYSTIEQANTSNVPLLLAHGNHDSYLMGTINTPLSGSDSHLQDWSPLSMKDSTIPTRESFWSKKAEIKARNEANWLNACFSPAVDDNQNIIPMNKSLWLATYIDHLENFGLIEHKESKNKNTAQSSYNLSYSVKENSALANIHYEAKGRWYPPIIENKAKNSKTYLVYKSFIVQKVRFDTTNVIIIDSSVCKLAGLWYEFLKANAGTKACIGKEQKKIISDYICKLDKHERLIIASHFPLNDLDSKDKSYLLGLMSSFNDAIYFSLLFFISKYVQASYLSIFNWKSIT